MKAYVIHVRDAYERERHMQTQLADKGFDVQYILQGDIADLTPEVIDRYFAGDMMKPFGGTSCAYKHLLAYEALLQSDDEMALILEDDICFYKNHALIWDMVNEVKQKQLTNFFISLEDSNLRYVPRSQRKSGQFLYPEHVGRFAGGYLIDRETARRLLLEAEQNKVSVPVDWFHNECAKKSLMSIYWSHPVILVQGSKNGLLDSFLEKGDNQDLYNYLRFVVHKGYKKFLYWLR